MHHVVGQRGDDNLRLRRCSRGKSCFFRNKGVIYLLAWEPTAVILLETGLPNPNMQERSFAVTFLDRTTVNMTSCFELEEETNEEDGSKDNCLGEPDKTVAATEAMPMNLNWRHIFSLPNETL